MLLKTKSNKALKDKFLNMVKERKEYEQIRKASMSKLQQEFEELDKKVSKNFNRNK